MSVNQTNKGPNELKRTNHIINEQIAKIQKDTQELINRTIDGQHSSVNVIKVSDNKIIIEVDLNEFNLSKQNSENLVDQPDDSTNDKSEQSNNTATKSTTKDETVQLNFDHQQSNYENTDSDEKPLRGILKYTNSWKKRTLSESSFDNSSFTDHEDDDNNYSLSFSCTDLDCLTNDRSSKKVTFNKQISKKEFSKNQAAIEARPKKKGKKKNANKKAKANDDKKSNEMSNKKQISSENNESKGESEKMTNVIVDDLSFLLASSSDSDVNAADVSGNLTNNSLIANGQSNDTEDDDDDTFFEQKIDHNLPIDKENAWSEVKSSHKKVKKNRKRNDSGSTTNSKPDEKSTTINSGNRELSCEDQASKQMSLGIKNALEIQVN